MLWDAGHNTALYPLPCAQQPPGLWEKGLYSWTASLDDCRLLELLPVGNNFKGCRIREKVTSMVFLLCIYSLKENWILGETTQTWKKLEFKQQENQGRKGCNTFLLHWFTHTKVDRMAFFIFFGLTNEADRASSQDFTFFNNIRKWRKSLSRTWSDFCIVGKRTKAPQGLISVLLL